jgi:hypothetical protein
MGKLIAILFGLPVIGAILSFTIAFLAIIRATLLCVPFMWGWDAVMPDVFGLPTITLGVSWGLLFTVCLAIPSGSSSSSDDD